MAFKFIKSTILSFVHFFGYDIVKIRRTKNNVPLNPNKKSTSGSRLYVGCGEDSREGYIGCDIRNLPNVSIVCKAWEVSQYCEDVKEVYSRHMLEHLTLPQVEVTLKDWYKALAIGGKVQIIVPNIDAHIEQWKRAVWNEETWNEKLSDARYAFAGFWGWQRESYTLENIQDANTFYWDVHKSGYNKEFLTFLFSRIGYSEIHCEIVDKVHLVAQAEKMMDQGERQISPNLGGIRGDHRGRYAFAKKYITGGEVILDIACGVGYGAYILASQTNCSRITAVDINAAAIEYGMKNFYSQKIDYKKGNCFTVEIQKSAYDIIISFETIEHIKDDFALMSRFYDLLKPKGMLICSTPNENKMPFTKENFPFHIKHYKPADLENLLKTAGFEVLEKWTQHNTTSDQISDGWDGLFNIAVCRKTG